MSDIDEPRIRCPSCGKSVPAMKYCIYCGAKLPQLPPRQVSPPTPQPSIPPPVPRTVPPPVPTRVTAPPISMGIEPEVASLMSNITSLYERKASLLEMIRAGEVSESIFLKLYNEYSNKLHDLLNARIRKIDEQRNRLDERNKRLTEVTLTLEELEVRHKIGEIDLNTFAQKAEKLKMEENELKESLKNIRMNLDRLERIMAEKKPREIRDLEVKITSCYDTLKKSAEEGKISIETLNKIRSDIEETIAFLGSLTMDRKEKEKELREQLEILQARYKLSEVSIEEFDRKKRELQEQIDKVWA